MKKLKRKLRKLLYALGWIDKMPVTATISATITRANGKVEELGVISETEMVLTKEEWAELMTKTKNKLFGKNVIKIEEKK